MSSPLHVWLGAAYDGRAAWRPDLTVGEARAGWLVAGPRALARRVAIAIGVPAVDRPEPMRVAAYAAALRAVDDGQRRFSQAFRADPLGVARHLLRLRDALRAHGWRGDPLTGSPRLADLAAAEAVADATVRAGAADLWHALSARLEAGARPPALHLTLADPRAAFPPAFLSLLDALARAGTPIAPAPGEGPAAPPDTDLGRVQRHLLGQPAAPLTGDGTWILLEAETPAEAADAVARWIREAPPTERQIVVGEHGATLDAALRADGAPGLGLSERSADRPAFQLLPLRLALRFDPPDPADALALVLLPGGPVGGPLRRRLARALEDHPGVGGPAWRNAIAAAAADAADAARATVTDVEDDGLPAWGEDDPLAAMLRDALDPSTRGDEAAAAAAEAVQARARRWLGDGEPRARLPREEVSQIALDTLQWLQGKAARDEDDRPDRVAAAAACGAFRRVVDALDAPEGLDRAAVWDAWRLAVGAGAVGAVAPAEAARAWPVDDPGAVRHTVETIWWGFDASAPSARLPAFSTAEAAELAGAGVRLPAPGADRAEEARRWRRALLAPTGRALLVRWRTSLREATGVHPLFDEIAHHPDPAWRPALDRCRIEAAAAFTRVDGPVGVGWSPTRALRPDRPLPRPRGVWRLSRRPLRLREPISYSQLERLGDCPLQWALGDVARLRAPRVSRLPADRPLIGTFLHALLADLLLTLSEGAELDAKGATAWVQAEFDRRLSLEAAVLTRPEKDTARAWARDVAGRAAARLVGVLEAGDWQVLGVEHAIAGTFAGHALEGSIDVLLGGRSDARRAIVDLKLARPDQHVELIKQGRALQLALYASAVERPEGAPPPVVAYLILSNSLFVGPEGHAPPGAIAAPGPTPEATLAGFERYLDTARRGLDEGLVAATGVRGWRHAWAAVAPTLPPPRDVVPGCDLCAYRALCHTSEGR